MQRRILRLLLHYQPGHQQLPAGALRRGMVEGHRVELLRFRLSLLHRLPRQVHLFELRQLLQPELQAVQLSLPVDFIV
jgi:hypothetical protein